jgi:hypothetical protein
MSGLSMAAKISRQRYLFDGPGTYYIDLFKSLSVQERKLFRQHQVANVMGGLIKDSNNESVVSINVAPDTWVTRAAVRRGKRLFDEMNRQALEAGVVAKSIKPKYHDYKVYLNNVMGAGTVLPVDADGHTLPSGEWEYSKYHSEDVDWNVIATAGAGQPSNRQADSFTAMIVGPHAGNAQDWTRVGLIRSWFDSRAEVDTNDPDVPVTITSDPLTNLFDEADAMDEVLESLRQDNDSPPYQFNSHWGIDQGNAAQNNLQRVAFAATQTGAGQISAMNGFSAICGLVEVQIAQGVGSGLVELLLDVSMKGEKI